MYMRGLVVLQTCILKLVVKSVSMSIPNIIN